VVGYGRASLLEGLDRAPEGYYLAGVFVRPDARRASIGGALTEARLRWIAERANEAWSFANARNVASLALHRRFGFEEVTRDFAVPGVTFGGGEGILFRLRLAGLPPAAR
jgi:GNAT superfamily N-acetyltransferase